MYNRLHAFSMVAAFFQEVAIFYKMLLYHYDL